MCLLAENLAFNKLGGRLDKVKYLYQMQSSCLSLARESALDFAEKNGYTHWLSLDDDMVFPADCVEQMLKHNLPVVSSNYRRKKNEVEGICLGLDLQPLDSTGKTGIEEISYMGGGCNLFDVKAVSAVKPPRFSILWVEEKQSYMSEDYYFSIRLKNEGIKLYCDHDLSQQVNHIGDCQYSFGG